MDEETVKKYVGKKVLIILKNNFQYTAIIPEFHGSGFSIIDKYGEPVEIECGYISLITIQGGRE